MVYRLEKQYSVFEIDKNLHVDSIKILILGGGHSIDPNHPAIDQLSLDALGRLSEGIRIYRIVKGAKLVCSGASASNRITQAEMLALAAIELGISPEDTLLSKLPINTSQEIITYSSRFGKAPFILVTSAIHMPRAMEFCSKNDLMPTPAPTNYLIKNDISVNKYDFIPSYFKIMLMQRAMHEYLGILKLKLSS